MDRFKPVSSDTAVWIDLDHGSQKQEFVEYSFCGGGVMIWYLQTIITIEVD